MRRFALSIRATLPSLWVGLLISLLMSQAAFADTVVLKNGTTLNGEVLSVNKVTGKVVMRVKVGSAQAEMTLDMKDVKTLELAKSDPAPQDEESDLPFQDKKKKKAAPAPVRPRTQVRKKRTIGPTRAKPGKQTYVGKRYLYLIDCSGSMAIGQRWKQATDQLERMIGRLKPGTPYDVMLFHDAVRSLFTSNNTLYKNKLSGRRAAKRMALEKPELRGGTNLYHAMIKALHRNPTRIVVISDGVLTRGGPYGADHALRKVREARAKGIAVDFLAAQDGRYQAPQVEDLSAARQLMGRFAREGGGVFFSLPNMTKAKAKLPQTFKPLEGTYDGTKVPWKIEILKPGLANRKRRVIIGHIPNRFRVRVWDPRVNRGEFLDVWEYGGAVWLDVHTGVDKVLNLRFHRSADGKYLISDREILIVGQLDARLRRGKLANRKFAVVQGKCGASVRIVYRRGNDKFTARRTTGGWAPVLPSPGPRGGGSWIQVADGR